MSILGISGTIPPSNLVQRDDLDVVYRVDANDRLAFVNDGWNAFAVENRTPELMGAAARDRIAVLEPDRPRSAALLTLCSWCNRGRIGDRWAEIEEVVAELRLFDAEVPRLTHGVCPSCVALVAAEVDS